jgi:uncharacterized protein YjiS (DUF1127 family)
MDLSKDSRLLFAGQQTARGTNVWPSRLRAGLVRLGTSWAARRRRAREIQQLQGFSDRELWDLGLHRSDLRAIINGTYRRD